MSVPKDSDDFSVGKVVSINNDGDLQLGGGFTLYKDVYVSPVQIIIQKNSIT